MINPFVPPTGYPPQYIVSKGFAVTDSWTRVSLTGYLLEYPTTDYQIHVATSAPPGSYVLIDDIQLEEGDLTSFSPAAPLEAGQRRAAIPRDGPKGRTRVRP